MLLIMTHHVRSGVGFSTYSIMSRAQKHSFWSLPSSYVLDLRCSSCSIMRETCGTEWFPLGEETSLLYILVAIFHEHVPQSQVWRCGHSTVISSAYELYSEIQSQKYPEKWCL